VLYPSEQNHGSNELVQDLNCALISLSRKSALWVRGKKYKSKGILLGISFEGAPTLNFGACERVRAQCGRVTKLRIIDQSAKFPNLGFLDFQ